VLFTSTGGRGKIPPSYPLIKEVDSSMDNKAKQRLQDRTFFVRKMTKAGSSRYLSVGKILPPDWEAIKIYMSVTADASIILKLVQIK